MITENDYNDIHSDNDSNNDDKNDNSYNDENNGNGDDRQIPMDSSHKGPIMVRFDVTFVESKNNSRVSGDWRRHVPHITSLWCDIFTQHRHICIVVSSYE